MSKQKGMLTLLFMAGCLFNNMTMADSPEAATPVNQSDYETIHQGVIQVTATLFNAPCNLQINVKGNILLTDCGAGTAFNEINSFNIGDHIPASIQFYDVYRKRSLPFYSINLRNGDNLITPPMRQLRVNAYRLEVSYD